MKSSGSLMVSLIIICLSILDVCDFRCYQLNIWLFRLLTKVYPKCRERKFYSCFVMDSAGFLIMHEDFLEHSEIAQDLEYVHITNKEKNIAEHLITNGYLKKRECRNLKEIQKQSFYEVDLPDGGVDVLKSGDSCSKYQLNKIVGTNAYLGL